jgi:TPR repeat protein
MQAAGSMQYMAPELHAHGQYGFQADVYAFGIIAYTVITGLEPFPQEWTPFEISSSVVKGERPAFPDGTPRIYINIIERCWQKIPDKRPQFAEIVWWLGLAAQVPELGIDIEKFEEYQTRVCPPELRPRNVRVPAYLLAAPVMSDIEKVKLAAEAGEPSAELKYAELLRDGRGITKNPKLALVWLNKAVEHNHPEALTVMGMALKTFNSGFPIKLNIAEATKRLRQAADLGDPVACYELGMMLNTSQSDRGDNPEAEKLLKQAADKGYGPGMGRYASMALARNNGHPSESDIAEAVKYYKMSSDHGVGLGMATLADFYWKGHYMDKDLREAIKLLTVASERGFEAATQALVEIYASGDEGVDMDAILAVRYVERLENGHGNESVFLGLVMRAMLMQNGIGCEQNDAGADELLAIASMKTYVHEQREYAYRLEHGFLCRRDPDAALVWGTKAQFNSQPSFRG